MLAIPHILAGAAVAKVARRPVLAFPAAFLCHFALDRVPHLDSHAMFGSTAGGITTMEAVAGIVDAAVAVSLLLFLIRHMDWRAGLALGGFAGILIDIVDNLPPWNHWFFAWPATGWLCRLHDAFQNNVTPDQWMLGLGTQVAATALSIAILVWQKQPKTATPAQVS